jgi:hypothetical protein
VVIAAGCPSELSNAKRTASCFVTVRPIAVSNAWQGGEERCDRLDRRTRTILLPKTTRQSGQDDAAGASGGIKRRLLALADRYEGRISDLAATSLSGEKRTRRVLHAYVLRRDPQTVRTSACRCPRPRRYAPALDLSRRKIALISPHSIKMVVDFAYVFLERSICCASSPWQQEDQSAKNERGATDD